MTNVTGVYTKSFTSFVNSTQAMHAFRPSSHTKTSDLVERILFSYIGRASCCPFHSSHFNISKRVDCIDPLHIAVNQLRAPSETILVRNSEAHRKLGSDRYWMNEYVNRQIDNNRRWNHIYLYQVRYIQQQYEINWTFIDNVQHSHLLIHHVIIMLHGLLQSDVFIEVPGTW